jgi:hypothetical protein
VRILKDFKSCVFGSADSEGVTGEFLGSADSKGFTWILELDRNVDGLGGSVRTMRFANTGESIIIVSKSQGIFTGVLFESVGSSEEERVGE